MTEKQYQMINTNLADENGRIYYNIQRNDGVNICQVYGKNNAKSLIDELNELAEENQAVKDIINELNSMDFYRDSALLDEYIGKIAMILGVDLE